MKVFFTVASLLIFSDAVSLAQEPPGLKRRSVRDIISRLNNDYNLLDRELKGLEDDISAFPRTTLFVSVVSKERYGDLRLASLEVYDDAGFIGSHVYSQLESDALAAGGRHQIYGGEVREGNRRLKIIYSWAEGGGPIQRGETVIPLSVTKGREYFLELSLSMKGGGSVALDSSQIEFRR